jgi:hypothetical protein
MKQPRQLRIALALALTSLLGACVVIPAPRHYGGGGEVVTVAPPAPQGEVVGVAPGPGFIWIGGFWNWIGGRHVWVGGHWESHRPGHRWVPHQWHRDGPGWRLAPGHWEER